MPEEEEGSCCAVQCQYIVPAASGICALSMFPVVYIFIAARIRGKLKSSKRLFYGGLLFFAVIFLTLTAWALFNATMCDYPRFNQISHNVFMQLYTLENMIFVAILFDRLYKIFQGTEFALDSCSIRAFIAFYLISATLVAAYGVCLANDLLFDSLLGPIGAAIGLLGLVLIAWVVCLYLYKLMQVYKYKRDDVALLPIITKTSLLCVISTLATFLLMLSLSLLTLHDSAWHALFHELLTVADVYTNYLCVWLSYQHFDAYYQRICGCCHAKCHRVWMRHFHRDAENVMLEIQSRSPSVRTMDSSEAASHSKSNGAETTTVNMSSSDGSKHNTDLE